MASLTAEACIDWRSLAIACVKQDARQLASGIRVIASRFNGVPGAKVLCKREHVIKANRSESQYHSSLVTSTLKLCHVPVNSEPSIPSLVVELLRPFG